MAGDDQRSWATRLHDHSQSYESTVSVGSVPHASTTGQTTDDHHAKSHAHNGADGSGTVAHGDLTGVGTDDHHTKYTDAEAVSAVEADTTLAITTGGLILPKGEIIADPGTDSGRIIVPYDSGTGYVTGNPHLVKGDGTSNYRLAFSSDITTHTADVDAHHAKYTDGEADARIAAAVLDDLSDVTETTITTGDVLRWNGSAWVNYADSAYEPALGSGTSFPGSPSVNDKYHRTDIYGGTEFFWNGTYWLSTTLYLDKPIDWAGAVGTEFGYIPWDTSGPDVYIEEVILQSLTSLASASHHIDVTVSKRAVDNTDTSIDTTDTQSDTVSVWVEHSLVTSGHLLDVSAYPILRFVCVVTGSPSAYGAMSVRYRLKAS